MSLHKEVVELVTLCNIGLGGFASVCLWSGGGGGGR